jgi:hypothetical protein
MPGRLYDGAVPQRWRWTGFGDLNQHGALDDPPAHSR